VVLACLSATAAVLIALLIWDSLSTGPNPIPMLAAVTGGLLTLCAMGLVRFRSRLFSFKRNPDAGRNDRTLIVGTGRAAAELSRSLRSTHDAGEVVGFVAEGGYDPIRRLAGLPVLGTVDDLADAVDEHEIDQVIVTGVDEGLAGRVLDECLWNSARLRIIPEVGAVLAGHSVSHDIRDLEITDLLPRPAVSTELDAVAQLIRGCRVLVTGAGGSIGSEIVSQVLEFEPAELVALDHDETHLYEAMLEWGRTGRRPHQALCDIRDRARLQRVFEEAKPEVVFHAAALKHVPILEESPEEAVLTNILGTFHVLEAARSVGARLLVNISTDKAVAPTSVMGSSKRLAELLVQDASIQDDDCVYSSVRFGNVLGSRGSVVPTFIRQIKSGGPVTISDPDMTRYFMTVDEAVHLVLQAAALADGGETFVLDMAEPVRIGDLAHRMIRLAGLVPGRDIRVEVTGRRPGEKMSEELSLEPLMPTSNPIRPRSDGFWERSSEPRGHVRRSKGEFSRRLQSGPETNRPFDQSPMVGADPRGGAGRHPGRAHNAAPQ
jgi:FlaA1/EpsC-like NDP-sugar epimerase